MSKDCKSSCSHQRHHCNTMNLCFTLTPPICNSFISHQLCHLKFYEMSKLDDLHHLHISILPSPICERPQDPSCTKLCSSSAPLCPRYLSLLDSPPPAKLSLPSTSTKKTQNEVLDSARRRAHRRRLGFPVVVGLAGGLAPPPRARRQGGHLLPVVPIRPVLRERHQLVPRAVGQGVLQPGYGPLARQRLRPGLQVRQRQVRLRLSGSSCIASTQIAQLAAVPCTQVESDARNESKIHMSHNQKPELKSLRSKVLSQNQFHRAIPLLTPA